MDSIHHIAIECDDVRRTVYWYLETFMCSVEHLDDTWAMLRFDNVRLALVTRGSHPPHLGFVMPDFMVQHPERHRDGTESQYVKDPSGNTIELIKKSSI
jgi:catechol 2,3-dioxygenase-like lactoylglutathione lyase family enzyme